MLKKLLALVVWALAAMSSFAAVEANKGSAADLQGLPGIGPAMSQRIVDARKQGEFKDWADFINRVSGVQSKTATKLSNGGLTINGKPYTADPAKPAAPAKAAAQPATKAPAAPPATAAPKK